MSRCERCGKRRYRTWKFAARIALRQSRVTGTALRIYRCPCGAGWHLTKQQKREEATG